MLFRSVAEGLLGGVVTAGRYVDIDANGALIENQPDGQVGIALESGIAGSIVPILLVNRAASGGADGVVSSATMNANVLELTRTQALPDVTVDLSQFDQSAAVVTAQAAADAAQLDIDNHRLTVGDHADVDLAGQVDGQILTRVEIGRAHV